MNDLPLALKMTTEEILIGVEETTELICTFQATLEREPIRQAKKNKW